jgi:hypothetical protein
MKEKYSIRLSERCAFILSKFRKICDFPKNLNALAGKDEDFVNQRFDNFSGGNCQKTRFVKVVKCRKAVWLNILPAKTYSNPRV